MDAIYTGERGYNMNPFGKSEVAETKEIKSAEDKLANSELGKKIEKAEKPARDIKISGKIELPDWLGGGGAGGSIEITTHDFNSDAKTSSQGQTNSVS